MVMAVLPTTQMACFDGSIFNHSPAGVPATASQFAVTMNVILSTVDTHSTFSITGNTGGLTALQVVAGWSVGLGDVVFVSVAGTTTLQGFWGPLSTPRGTQFALEVHIDAGAATVSVLENGTPLAGGLSIAIPGNVLQFTDFDWTSFTLEHQCAGDLGLWIGTPIPSGTPAIFLTIPPMGTITDFPTNSTGTIGAFSTGGLHGTCDACFGPPPGDHAILSMDNVVVTSLTAESPCTARLFDPSFAAIGPSLGLRWSDTRGLTFGNAVPQDFRIDPLWQAQWNRTGMARDRVFELFYSAALKSAINGAFVEVFPLKT